MSEIKVAKITPRVDNGDIALGESGDTVTLGTGAQFISGGDIVVPSGGSLTVNSGATITNNGTNGGGFGKVLQTVSSSYSTGSSTTSTSFVDSGLSATITPASASNKILLWVHSAWFCTDVNTNPNATARIYNSTDGVELGSLVLNGYGSSVSNVRESMSCAMVIEDSGRSVATTYKLQHKVVATDRNSTLQNGNTTAWMILMEIAA